MKLVNYVFLILLSLTLISCKDEGGGVIVVEDPEVYVPPVFQGPFGGPVVGDSQVPAPSPYLPPYATFELQALINDTPDGGTLELERDADLKNFGLNISKAITITSKPGLTKPVKIKATGLTTLFNMQADNLTFSNLIFELININEFVSGDIDPISTLPLYSGLNMTNSQVLLRGSSSLLINLNGVSIQKSTILGLSGFRRNEDLAVARFKGNNLTLTSNLFADVYNSYTTTIGLLDVEGALIKENVIRSYASKLYGAITATDIKDISLESNILYDANVDKINIEFGEDPELTGSIALSFQFADNFTDNGLTNSFNAQLFRYDDVDEGGSININLSPGNNVNAFDGEDLFNFLPTEDFTPYCGIGTNPTISVTPKASWSSYVRQNNSTLYYAGAIKPACL